MEIFGEFFQLENLFKLGQIILVDLVLAGDNAIVIGLVAARFSVEHRRKVILYGVGAAVLLRILFAVITVQLLAIKGLLLVGGLLLLWICWKLWVDLRNPAPSPTPAAANLDADKKTAANPPMLASIMQILIADLSMSLDNVLAVAAVADGHTGLLILGLAIAVAFMTFSAALIAGILQKHRWVGYAGLAVIVYVGLRMSIEGAIEVAEVLPLLF
ncbi:MAG: YjbE family putative metal transport protein [Gammaproteobacteria bacterium]|nr:YjbE family putative metal transport protein [Gammaproteobacteria bacterium]